MKIYNEFVKYDVLMISSTILSNWINIVLSKSRDNNSHCFPVSKITTRAKIAVELKYELWGLQVTVKGEHLSSCNLRKMEEFCSLHSVTYSWILLQCSETLNYFCDFIKSLKDFQDVQ